MTFRCNMGEAKRAAARARYEAYKASLKFIDKSSWDAEITLTSEHCFDCGKKKEGCASEDGTVIA